MSTSQGNYRARPTFNKDFNLLRDVVAFALDSFKNRPRQRFLILKKPGQFLYSVMPWSQFRDPSADDERKLWTTLWHGDLYQLREISLAYPPEFTLTEETPPDDTGMDTTEH